MNKKRHLYKRPNPVEDAKIKVTNRIIDEDSTNRIGLQNPTYIVIHEVSLGTGKSPITYNMEHYANMVKQYGKIGRSVGFHYVVGDKEVCQFIPDDVATEHTGTKFGNTNSISVERLICEGINYEYATHNQAKLIATLMLKHNIPLENVLTHKEMQRRFGEGEKKANPKQCPSRMLAGFRGTVQDFKTEIKRCFIYGWFFEDLLDEKTKNNIPKIQEVAKERFASKNSELTPPKMLRDER